MKEWIEKFLQSLPNTNTAAAYRNDLEQFQDFLFTFESASAPRVTRLADVTETHFQEFRFFLQEREYAPTTLARKLASVRALYRFLEASAEAKAEATRALGQQSVQRSQPDVLTKDEIQELLDAPGRAGGTLETRDTALLHLLYQSRLRATKLLQLNLCCVDPAGQRIRSCCVTGADVTLTKTAGQAVAGLSAELQSREGLARRPLFQNPRGQRLTRQGLWTILKRYAASTSIGKPLNLETVRHSRVAHLLGRDVDSDAGASTETSQMAAAVV